MKTVKSTFKLLILILVTVFALCSCAQIFDLIGIPNGGGSNDTDNGGEHLHSYIAKITAPTCTEDGYTTYTSDCGEE